MDATVEVDDLAVHVHVHRYVHVFKTVMAHVNDPDASALPVILDRLDSLERNMDRLMTMLELRTRMASADLLTGATAALGSAEDRLSAALVEIAEPEILGALTRIATLAPQLEAAAHVAADALSEQPALLTALEQLLTTLPRVASLLDALPAASVMLDALPRLTLLLDLLPRAASVLDALPPAHVVRERLGRAGHAIAEVLAQGAPRVGAWSALGALREPAVQAVLGFAVELTRKLGAQLPPKHG